MNEIFEAPGLVPESDNDKIMGIVAYITLIGWFVALVAGANNGYRSDYLKFHLNNGFTLWLIGFLGFIPFFGWIVSVVVLILWVITLIGAINGQAKLIPVIGQIRIFK
jgi:uncharacterized membrane protein